MSKTELVDDASEHTTGVDYDLQQLALQDPWRPTASS